MNVPVADFEEQTLLYIKAWAVDAYKYNRKALHLQWPDKLPYEALDAVRIESLKNRPKPDFDDVLPDHVLDSIGALTQPSVFAPVDGVAGVAAVAPVADGRPGSSGD